jgi:hypothetical protein
VKGSQQTIASAMALPSLFTCWVTSSLKGKVYL